MLILKLITLDDVKDYLKKVESCDYDIVLSKGKFSTDGKSLMGILAMLGGTNIIAHIQNEFIEDFKSRCIDYIVEI